MTTTTTRDGVVYGMADAVYHAGPELSSTGARRLLESPARYRWETDHPQAGKEAFDVGTAVHTKVLGTGAGTIAYPEEHLTPSGSVSSKAATVAWAAEKRAEGFVPISPDQADQVNGMAEAVLKHPTGRRLFEQDGNAEASLFATDPDTGIRMRARFDYLAPIGVDLKSTSGLASPSGFAKSAASYGYDVQQGHYETVDQIITGTLRPFVFVVVEKAAPYLVGVHQLDKDFTDIGRGKARRARELYATCTDTGVWPGYPTDIQLTVPPMWAIYDFQDNYS
jgi:hypothetical protein